MNSQLRSTARLLQPFTHDQKIFQVASGRLTTGSHRYVRRSARSERHGAFRHHTRRGSQLQHLYIRGVVCGCGGVWCGAGSHAVFVLSERVTEPTRQDIRQVDARSHSLLRHESHW